MFFSIRVVRQNSSGDSQPNSPSFFPRRHSSCIDDSMDSETDSVSSFTIVLVEDTVCVMYLILSYCIVYANNMNNMLASRDLVHKVIYYVMVYFRYFVFLSSWLWSIWLMINRLTDAALEYFLNNWSASYFLLFERFP